MFPRWLSTRFAGVAKRRRSERRRAQKSTRPPTRLLLEQLEDRSIPSTFVVNELLDTHALSRVSGMDASGQVSLRSAIEAADHLGGNQTIQFDASVFAAPETITLTLAQLDLKESG